MNYYRRYPGDYQRDTGHLSLVEHGVYNVLLDAYYATNGNIPRHFSELNRVCRAMTKTERLAVQNVAQQFFPTDDAGARHNKRADAELKISLDAIRKMSDAGKAGSKLKWDTKDSASGKTGKALRNERLAAARLLETHTDEQWFSMVDYHNGKCVKCGVDQKIVKDHIKPISKGGSDGIANIQPLCRSCNTGKGPDETDHRLDGWEEKCLT